MIRIIYDFYSLLYYHLIGKLYIINFVYIQDVNIVTQYSYFNASSIFLWIVSLFIFIFLFIYKLKIIKFNQYSINLMNI